MLTPRRKASCARSGKRPGANTSQDCGDDLSHPSSDAEDHDDNRTPPTLSSVYIESNLFSDQDSEPEDWWFAEDERDVGGLPQLERVKRLYKQNRVLCRALRRTKALKPKSRINQAEFLEIQRDRTTLRHRVEAQDKRIRQLTQSLQISINRHNPKLADLTPLWKRKELAAKEAADKASAASRESSVVEIDNSDSSVAGGRPPSSSSGWKRRPQTG